MEDVSIVGLDLAKRVFQVRGASSDGRVVCRKKLSRGQLRAFFAQLPPCVVAMEACATAHGWGHAERLKIDSKANPWLTGRLVDLRMVIRLVIASEEEERIGALHGDLFRH